MSESNKSVETVRHNLQLNENIKQHKKGWSIQKIGWAILYIGLVLALLGLFGTGPLSRKTISQNGHSVKYERFLRYEGEAEMTFNIDAAKDTIRLEIPQEYLEYIDVKSITPLPSGNTTINGITTYFFNALGTASIHCNLMAKKPGSVTSILKVNETPFKIDHQIYP
ncbi:hypothetical protein [Niastella sp. OAS944]|uniref:hypothetical protein n=1 Tax=Niastella sp. OAS944 TaxID=2664089 RepID=UPI00348A8D02|nr:hypothetical protein [Chitinophagaceae bacterium OAS944]